jgi:hypothetical protein
MALEGLKLARDIKDGLSDDHVLERARGMRVKSRRAENAALDEELRRKASEPRE